MSKEYDFLNELADLLEKYDIEIEVNYDEIDWDVYESYIDFDFQTTRYTTIKFTDVYLTSKDFREKAKGYKKDE